MLVLLLYVKEVTIIIDKKEASLLVAESNIHKFFKVWVNSNGGAHITLISVRGSLPFVRSIAGDSAFLYCLAPAPSA